MMVEEILALNNDAPPNEILTHEKILMIMKVLDYQPKIAVEDGIRSNA